MASQEMEANMLVQEGQDGKLVPTVSGEDTASSSSRGGDDDGESEDDGESSVEEEDPPMPLLSYTRLFGSLPRRQVSSDGQPTDQSRTFTVPSTCCCIAQVNLSKQDPAANSAPGSGISSPNPEANDQALTPDAARRGSPQSQYFVPYGDPLLSQQPHYVMALGYANGSVDLVDPRTGVAVISSQQLKLRQSTQHRPEAIIDLSMDSTGSFLAAIDSGLMAVIWEFRYTMALQSTAAPNANNHDGSPVQATTQQQQQPPPATPETGVFSSFMSALTLGGSTPSAPPSAMTVESAPPSTAPDAAPVDAGSMVPRLAISSIQLSRITYPKSFGVPTCIAIDPTYSKRRDKAVLVGFLDGRLVLTKRGIIFQRRTDAIIYQGTYNENSHNHQGIEAIEWRGNLAAWADAR
jgi:vacuolar protein sorting-associated protein 41